MNDNLKPSGACRALVRQSEGCYLQAYPCSAGVPTLGVGHTRGVRLGDRCSVQQADIWLSQDLEEAASYVAHLVKVPLTQCQFDALVSLTYNIGAGAFAKSTLLILVNKGAMDAAADQFPLWCHSNGKTLPGLVERRNSERALFKGS